MCMHYRVLRCTTLYDVYYYYVSRGEQQRTAEDSGAAESEE